MPLAGFFFVFCALTVLLCPDCPVFAFVLTIRHTQHKFEPVTPVSDWPHTLALDGSTTGLSIEPGTC